MLVTTLVVISVTSSTAPALAPALTAAAEDSASGDYHRPVVAGNLTAPGLEESSGLAASPCQDVLWTHNDSGKAPLLYGVDTRGRHLGTWRVTGARNQDWEAIAATRDPDGDCSLIIGDNDAERGQVQLYRIPEPTLRTSTVSTARSAATPARTARAQTLTLRYPDGPHNAETLLVHPRTGDIHIVTKQDKGPASVFRAKPTFGAAVAGQKIAEVSIPSTPEGRITDGSFSPDGTRVMLCDEHAGYELAAAPARADTEPATPAPLWRQQPRKLDLGERPQGEGVTYSRDGRTLFASSENTNAALYAIKRRTATEPTHHRGGPPALADTAHPRPSPR